MLLLFTHNSPNQTLCLIRASSWHLSGVWQAGQLVKRREVLKVGVYFVPTWSSITDVRASRQMWSLSSDWKDIFPVSSDKHLFFGDVSSLKKNTNYGLKGGATYNLINLNWNLKLSVLASEGLLYFTPNPFALNFDRALWVKHSTFTADEEQVYWGCIKDCLGQQKRNSTLWAIGTGASSRKTDLKVLLL